MPTKRAILAELTRAELRGNVDDYELTVDDRRVKAQLENALARSRKARIDEILNRQLRDRLKELCRFFVLDDSGWKMEEISLDQIERIHFCASRPRTLQDTIMDR